MSSNLPPTGPPTGPPSGPPYGPPGSSWGPPSGGPVGPPPSQPPAGWQQGSAEVLHSGAGGPVAPRGGARGGGGRRAGFLAGGALLGVGVLAAGAWAGYSMFLATGSQPAEALPASTVGYVSVDLDPSGKQKLEALQTLRKFPAFADNVDVTEDDDLRLRFFEEIQGDGTCPEVDFADDIDPWLGNRFAAAAIDLGGDETEGLGGTGVTGVVVFQVDDDAAAEDGLATLSACGGAEEQFGWSVVDNWAIVAETTEIAQQVSDAAGDEPLAGDDDFQRWTEEAGDPGILTAYLAPEAGALINEAFATFAGFGALGDAIALDCVPPLDEDPFAEDPFGEDPFADDPFADDPFAEDPFAACEDAVDPGVATDQLAGVLDGFEGAAVTIRFDDGGLEVETAFGNSSMDATTGVGDAGDDVLSTLPATTAVALGIGLEEGWFDGVRESADGVLGAGGLEEFLALAENETGLALPEDLETLLGESSAIALDGDADLTSFEQSEPPTDLALGVKVKGDADAIAEILDKLVTTTGDPALEQLLGFDTDGDFVAAGPSADYRATLLEDGGLGDTDTYQDAVLDSDDAGAVLFVNFDAGDWLTSLPDFPGEVEENLDPLRALGISSWSEDGVGHTAVRITTN